MFKDGLKRKLTAILSADVEGYSRLMGEDEVSTIRTLKRYKEVIAKLVVNYRGRVVDAPGDNLLAEFASVVDGVQCAVEIQRELAECNEDSSQECKMYFRIGVNLGDVVEEEDRIYGDGVNIAARMESLCEGGGVCISGTAFEHVENKLDLEFEDLGEHEVKNIKKPVRVYRVLSYPGAAADRVVQARETLKRRWRKIGFSAAAIVLVAVALGFWQFYMRRPAVEPASAEKMAFPLPEKPSIAVLPFDNMSGDPDQDYIADGFTENIITGLSQIPDMFVIARNSVFTYKGKPVKVKQVSEELGVKFVLEGSIQKSGDRLRVNAQLIDAIKGHHLWAERYDQELKDLFAIQDEITLKILNAMEVKLTVGKSANWFRTDNFEAWSFFTKGFSLVNRLTMEGLLEARKHFEHAASLEPDYAPAWTMQAWVNTIEVLMGFSKSSGDSINQALELAQKSAALDERQPTLHSLMNRIYRLQGKFDEAIAEGEKAVALIPNESRAHIFLAESLHYGGRPEEAIVHAKKAMRLEPNYPAWFWAQLAGPYDMLGRHEEAIAIWKKYLEQARGETVRVIQHERLTTSYASLDRMEEARFHAAEILKIKPDYTVDSFRKRARFYKDKAYVEKRVNLLLKAGLPDKPPLKYPDKPSIAVLPFVNMSDDPKQEYFADGMTDELITDLSKISGLLVISRNSSSTYKGKTVNVRQVADELKVKYVLEGSIQRAGDRVRIRAQLIDGTTDHHIWAESYDAVMENIFDLQDEITQKIAAVLAVKLTVGEQNRFADKETTNIEAYDAFVKGWDYLHKKTPEDLIHAVSFFKQAVDLDPLYSRAHAALAWTYLWSSLGFDFVKFANVLFQYRLLARKHLILAMRNPTSTAHLVASKMALQRRHYEDAVNHAQAALAFDANDPDANLNMAWVLMATGKPAEGLELVNRTIQLDPRNMADPLFFAGIAHFIMGDLREAATIIERAIKHNPTTFGRYEVLSAIYALLGRSEDAHAAYLKALKAWAPNRIPAHLITLMSYFPVKDRQVADLYADGLAKAGFPGQPKEYYKIYKENKLTGEEVRSLISGQEITVHENNQEFWIDHSKNGKLMNISWAREGKWWIEDDMLCYQMESGKLKDLNDCGEIYRNTDELTRSEMQYLHVKDYIIAALTSKE